MKNKKEKVIIVIIAIAIFGLILLTNSNDSGNYDYCIEWESLDEEGKRF